MDTRELPCCRSGRVGLGVARPAGRCGASGETPTGRSCCRRRHRLRVSYGSSPGVYPPRPLSVCQAGPSNEQTLNLQIIPLLSDVNHWTIYLNVTSTPAKYFVFSRGEVLLLTSRREAILGIWIVTHSKDLLLINNLYILLIIYIYSHMNEQMKIVLYFIMLVIIHMSFLSIIMRKNF